MQSTSCPHTNRLPTLQMEMPAHRLLCRLLQEELGSFQYSQQATASSSSKCSINTTQDKDCLSPACGRKHSFLPAPI